MGGACSGRRVPKKILLTGPKGSGKTTLLYFWCQTAITEPASTESFNVETVKHDTFEPLVIWDVTDPTRRRQFYHGTDAIVYMFECKDNSDLTNIKADLRTTLNDRDLKNLPVLVVFGKQDLTDISYEKAEQILKDLDLKTVRPYAQVQTRKDDPETYQNALKQLVQVMYCESGY